MAIGAAFPANPTNGQTYTFSGIVYTYDATLKKWVAAAAGQGGGASVSVGDTAPSDPNEGDLWFYEGGTGNTDVAQLYVYVDTTGDGTADSWIVATPMSGGGGGGSLTVEDLVTGDLTVTGALEAAEASIKQLFFLDATGSTLQLSQQLQVGDLVIGDDAIPTSGSGLLAVGSDGQTGDPDNTTAGTTTGDFAVGDTSQFLSWDSSEGELRIQGEIVNVGPEYTSGRLLTKYAFDRTNVGTVSGNTTGSQSIVGILNQLGGAGTFGFAICGGGGGGANTRSGNHKAFGGGAGGMALFAYEWDGTTDISVNLGVGGTANNANNNNYSSDGNAGNGSIFAIAGSTRVTANGGAAGNRATNGSAIEVTSGQTRANATFNAEATDFPAFSHICTSGISGGAGAAHQAGMGGGGIQITPWNPTGVFALANSADSGTTPVTNSNNFGYGSSGGCPWGPGVATGGSNNTRTSYSPFRLDAGGADISVPAQPSDRVVHPIGYDGYYDSDEVRIPLMFGETLFRGGDGAGGGNIVGTSSSGGLFCGGGGAGRRSSSNTTAGDGGLGGGGGGASSQGGTGNIGGDGGDGAIVIWRIS